MLQQTEITIRVQSANQLLLHPRDLFYNKRSLNADAEEYIIEHAALLPRREPISLIVTMPADELSKADEITEAIHNHFAYLREKSERQISQTLKLGGRNLIIGFVFLGLLVLLVQTATPLVPAGGLTSTIRESLIILGWVALWRPAELLLYDWFPHKRDAKLYGRIENGKVEVVEEGQ